MKTKFILHGGHSARQSENNRNFFQEILQSVNSNNLRILCIYFARSQNRWEESFNEDKKIFNSIKSHKLLTLNIASLDKKKLTDQILNSDIIFIQGGMKGNLKEKLEELDNFLELIKGKVVVGISAGANILSKYYYSSVAQGVREGIGILPFKTFCHYKEENTPELKNLDKYKEELPIYKIPEEKFVVINSDKRG